MSTNELNIFLNSFHRPVNFSDSAWQKLLSQSKEVWNAFLNGEEWRNTLDITCKEAYLMLVNKEGKLILKDESLLNYVKNEHVKSWGKRLEEIAYKAIRDKRYSIAERYFGKLIKLDATNPIHFYRRALTRMQQLKNKAALEDLSNAIMLNSSVAAFYFKRSEVFRILDVDHKAMADLNMGLKLNPTNAEAYQTRGRFRISLGDRVGGRLDLLRYEELIDSNQKEERNDLGYAA